MVIDDLADRTHDCDLLLDQNLGRQESDYLRSVPTACTKLIGPEYALLRPEFARLRSESLTRRSEPELKRVLISLGGVDEHNVTSAVLRTLRDGDLPDDCRLTIVMGPNSPWLDAVRKEAATLPWATEVRVGVSDMARLMAHSDLSIGAGGGTTWERCCLGLPTVMIVLAENQLAAAKALGDRVVSLLSPQDISTGLSESLHMAAKSLGCLSRLAAELVDGLGVERVYAAMEARAVS
jgi:UDP-2,4-diacetamido-2,4,6-trideoxy-beta-L-altropyranose hydrolase